MASIFRFSFIMESNYLATDVNYNDVINEIEDKFNTFSNEFVKTENKDSSDQKIYNFYNKLYKYYKELFFGDEKLILEVLDSNIKDNVNIHELSIKREEAIKAFDEMMLIYFLKYLKDKLSLELKSKKIIPYCFSNGIDNRIFEYYQFGTFNTYIEYINELYKGNDIKNPINTILREENINKTLSTLYDNDLNVSLTFTDLNIYDTGKTFDEQFKFIYQKSLRMVMDDFISKKRVDESKSCCELEEENFPYLLEKVDMIRNIMYQAYKDIYYGLKDKDTLICELEDGFDFFEVIKGTMFIKHNPLLYKTEEEIATNLFNYKIKEDISKDDVIKEIALLYNHIYEIYSKKSFIRKMYLFRSDLTSLEANALLKINDKLKEKFNLTEEEIIDLTSKYAKEILEKQEKEASCMERVSKKLVYKKEEKEQ